MEVLSETLSILPTLSTLSVEVERVSVSHSDVTRTPVLKVRRTTGLQGGGPGTRADGQTKWRWGLYVKRSDYSDGDEKPRRMKLYVYLMSM